MERYFNIAGPCLPGEHGMLPALDRPPGIRAMAGSLLGANRRLAEKQNHLLRKQP